jgi:hypothetical protein
MKLKIPGLNITLFENNKDNLFSISESTTKNTNKYNPHPSHHLASHPNKNTNIKIFVFL